jgi:uncharacterized protein (DUF2141 family)
MTKRLLCFFLALCAFGSLAAQTRGLLVRASGFRSDKGKARFYLFSRADGYPDELGRAFLSREASVSGGSASVFFVPEPNAPIPPGEYAIALIHDENGNGRLDLGLFGIPLEGYGASRDARGKRGGPSFPDAAFAYDGAGLELDLSVEYVR